MLVNFDEMKKVDTPAIKSAITLWNTRLEAMKKAENMKDLICYLGTPVEWSDNCEGNV
ncbi:hypothetical protein [Acetivibrio clariflavus]|uniref:Uncharacterized protein n=1 Tax=Acetivibrio clariflavus (strain DSM 19732 / NBRC 101661 / EBR45) TaxID=720554 RepID=G8LSH7_ACECE|nr:hypothetical protein [Acetivibrio clariflavus]AEV68281.1 hypothetical protein Clocl_1658 [Acetivibrio clariflavus DSM 19732]